MIPALVLSAGLAMRLRPLSLVRAKAALPVAGQPLLRRILAGLRSAGISDVVINLHHLPHTITGIVGDGSDLDVRVRYSWEQPLLGSAGGPRLALPLLGSPTSLIANGDTLTNADIPAVIAAHRRSSALVTLAVTANPDPQKYGGVLVADDGAVTGFTTRGSGLPSWHFVGVQVVEERAFASVPSGEPFASVGRLYPALIAAAPGSVRAHVCDAEFFDIGTPADYLETSLVLARRETGASLHGYRTHVEPSASVHRSILWDDVTIGERAMLRECVVTDGASVPPGTSWSRVVLRAAIGELAPGEARVGDLAVVPL